MSVVSQTFGLPMTRHVRQNMRHGSSLAAVGVRIWRLWLADLRASLHAAAQRREERKLIALIQECEGSMPSFASDLRAALARR